MKLFKSRTMEKEKEEPLPLPARFYEGKDDDDDSINGFDNETKKAVEMENMLGKVLSMTERNSGSIISLQRSGTYEMGRKFASLQNMDDASISDVHLQNNDTFSYISRTSSLQSAASLPTFVKVEQGDPVILSQRSWDFITDKNDGESLSSQIGERTSAVPKGREAAKSIDPTVPAPRRSWNKLRQEIGEGEYGGTIGSGEASAAMSRSVSLGKMGLNFRKKKAKESRRVKRSSTRATRELSPLKKQTHRGNHSDDKNSGSEDKHYAKDCDVEVALQEKKKSIWKRYPSMLRDSAKRKSTKNKSKDVDTSIDTSIDTPKSNDATEELSNSPPQIEHSIVEQKPKVLVQMNSVDVLMESLELVCCAGNEEALDNITDMIPPYV